jgi:hypothetical protein
VAEKSLPLPLHSPVRGRGKGGAISTALKIFLIKHLNYHQKHTENDIFHENL